MGGAASEVSEKWGAKARGLPGASHSLVTRAPAGSPSSRFTSPSFRPYFPQALIAWLSLSPQHQAT